MEVRKKGKGKSQNQRLKLFYLLEHTDETHTVKAQEISEYLFNHYRIPVEQKTAAPRKAGNIKHIGCPSKGLADVSF